MTATARVEGTIDLRWQDSGGGEDGFGVERWDPGSQAFVELGYVGSDVTSFTDANVQPGTTYRYRVSAVNAIGESPFSNEVTITAK